MKQPNPTSIRSYRAQNGRYHFDRWLETLDTRTKAIVLRDVGKLLKNLGFVKSIANKLWELKIDYGPGYRVYFTHEGAEIVLLLAGSDKGSQERTILLAKELIKEIEHRQ